MFHKHIAPHLFLVLMYFFVPLALSFSFTRKPEQPMVIVLNNNSTDVVFRWEVSLANGDIFSYLTFKRYEKDKGLVSSGVTLGFYQPGYANVDTTLYSLHTNVSNGPSSGYVRFTIKDIMKQRNNKDGSTADARSIDYVYLLVMKILDIQDEVVSDVEMRLFVKVYNFLGPNNVSVSQSEQFNVSCSADGKPSPSLTVVLPNGVEIKRNKTLDINLTAYKNMSGKYNCTAENEVTTPQIKSAWLNVWYLDSLIANGNTNKSYSQSNPVIWFNLSVNAYPSNVSLSCKSSVPNILTVISNQNTRFSHAKQYLVIVIIKSAVDNGSIVCKAEHITGEREITLDFYRQTTVFREEFSGQFEITNQEWHDDLGKPESNRFKILKGKCTKIFKAAYDGITFLASIKIKEFLKGSVIVQFQLEVIKQVPDPLLPLKTYIKQKGGEIEGLRIDYNSIQKSKGLKPETRISQTDNETIIAAVLGTLFALSIVLNIILIAYLIWVRTKDSRRDSVLRRYCNEEMGQTNDITLQETNFSNPGMSAPNSELEYEPRGRRGLVTSNPGISEHEAVATRTRPTQPPSGADNPVPQYERVHRQGQPGTPSNQPSAIYRNIPGGQSGNYGSLDPSTRLPHQGTSQTGEYQALQRKVVSPQYQSLDDLSRY